jgi:hypothetical protein
MGSAIGDPGGGQRRDQTRENPERLRPQSLVAVELSAAPFAPADERTGTRDGGDKRYARQDRRGRARRHQEVPCPHTDASEEARVRESRERPYVQALALSRPT